MRELADVLCSEDDKKALDELATRLNVAAAIIAKKTPSLQPVQELETWRISDRMRNDARSTVSRVLESGELKQPAVFRRTVAMIFSGPKETSGESSRDRSRRIVRFGLTWCQEAQRYNTYRSYG